MTVWEWPQWVFAVMLAANIVAAVATSDNAPQARVLKLGSACLGGWILYMGGFWT